MIAYFLFLPTQCLIFLEIPFQLIKYEVKDFSDFNYTKHKLIQYYFKPTVRQKCIYTNAVFSKNILKNNLLNHHVICHIINSGCKD